MEPVYNWLPDPSANINFRFFCPTFNQKFFPEVILIFTQSRRFVWRFTSGTLRTSSRLRALFYSSGIRTAPSLARFSGGTYKSTRKRQWRRCSIFSHQVSWSGSEALLPGWLGIPVRLRSIVHNVLHKYSTIELLLLDAVRYSLLCPIPVY